MYQALFFSPLEPKKQRSKKKKKKKPPDLRLCWDKTDFLTSLNVPRLSASYARLLCKHDAHWQNLTYFVTAVMTNTAHLALCYWGKKLYKQRFVSIYREVPES